VPRVASMNALAFGMGNVLFSGQSMARWSEGSGGANGLLQLRHSRKRRQYEVRKGSPEGRVVFLRRGWTFVGSRECEGAHEEKAVRQLPAALHYQRGRIERTTVFKG